MPVLGRLFRIVALYGAVAAAGCGGTVNSDTNCPRILSFRMPASADSRPSENGERTQCAASIAPRTIRCAGAGFCDVGQVPEGMWVSDSVDYIPSFKDGVEQFRTFLRNLGHEGGIRWTFREDFYSGSNSHMWIRWPPPGVNPAVALAVSRQDAGEGWWKSRPYIASAPASPLPSSRLHPMRFRARNQGLKLSVRTTLTQAEPVSSGLLWAFHRRRPEYAHFQQRDTFVHSRSVAAYTRRCRQTDASVATPPHIRR